MRSIDHGSPILEGNEAERVVDLLQDFIAALSFAVEAIGSAQPSRLENGVEFYEEVRRFEIALIKRALKQTRGNQTQAARLLHLNQTTLHGKLKHYKIFPVGVENNEQDSLITPNESESRDTSEG